MDTIKGLILILQVIVSVAAAPRAIYCLNKIVTDNEQASLYKRRMKNLITFVVISICALQLLSLIYSAYLT